MIKETEVQKNQRLKNLEQIRKLRQILVKDRSLARAAFDRLTRNQKRYLLMASGLDPQMHSWGKLTDSDVKKIQMGIKRLQLIINEFKNCNDDDFSRTSAEITNPQNIGINHDIKINAVA